MTWDVWGESQVRKLRHRQGRKPQAQGCEWGLEPGWASAFRFAVSVLAPGVWPREHLPALSPVLHTWKDAQAEAGKAVGARRALKATRPAVVAEATECRQTTT